MTHSKHCMAQIIRDAAENLRDNSEYDGDNFFTDVAVEAEKYADNYEEYYGHSCLC